MSSYLNETGLAYLWLKIKATFIKKSDTTPATSIGIDSTPTANSSNLVTSGGVKSALDTKLSTIDSSHKLSADLILDGSTNKVFTSTEKTKLSGIASGAEVNVQADWSVTSTTSDAYIKNKPTIPDSLSDLTQDIYYAASGTSGGAALKTGSIPFGIVDSTSTATVFTATVPGITELTDGTCVLLKNGVITSAANFTININGLGAHPAFNNMTAATAETTIFNINYTMLFVYDSTRVIGSYTGAWCCYRGYDANTNTIGYQVRGNNGSKPCSDTARYYKIYFTSADGSKWVPASVNSVNNAAAAKTVNQRPINPWGPIVYTSATTNYTAGTVLAATTIWQLYALTLGHSFNWTGAALTLTINKPVYVKCAPQSDGSAIMDSTTPIVQDLPTTEDGKIYIFLGLAYNTTTIELRLEHPVFYYKGGAIRLWTNAADTTLGTLNTSNTTALTASSSESFGNTINLHKVSKTGSYSDLLNKPSIPDDSNLVHKTGNEMITGDKKFQNLTYGITVSSLRPSIIILSTSSFPYIDLTGTTTSLTPPLEEDFSWIRYFGIGYSASKAPDPGTVSVAKTLQQALDERSNVQADWNQTTTTADDYIKNKPTIKDELSSEYEMSSDSNEDLALAPGDTYEEAFGKLEKATIDNEYVVTSALNDLNNRVNDVTYSSSNKLSADLIEDGTTNKVYTATEQTKLSGIAAGAEVNVLANWNESDSSSDAYIQNKPTIPTVTFRLWTTT